MASHPCVVLKTFTKKLYNYEPSVFLDNVFFNLDYVLICNQHITNVFTYILKRELPNFEQIYKKGLFPSFLGKYDQNIIKENIDRINEEIDAIEPKESKPIGNFNDWGPTHLSYMDLFDLRVPYKEIVALMKYVNDPEITKAEYGYYIGSLLKIKADEYQKKWPHYFKQKVSTAGCGAVNWTIFMRRVETFRKTVFHTIETKGK